jgi:hypothetical protein
MGRRPRSRASRSERRMLKERAASALKHGLPVPMPPPARTRVPEPLSSRSSSAPPSGGRASTAPNRRMPLAVKFLGIGLLLLGVIYGLTLFRDHKREANVALTPAESDTTSSAAAATSLATRPALVQPALASPQALTGGLPSAAPSSRGAALHTPSARPPLSPATATQPTASAPLARKAPVIAALPSPPHAPASTPSLATANAAAAPTVPNPAPPPAPTAAPAASK